MDLQLYARVLWRFRILVVGGLLMAVTLAILSYTSVSFGGGKPSFTYRQSEQWESISTIFLKSKEFNIGNAIDPQTLQGLKLAGDPEAVKEALKNLDPAELADPTYLTMLAQIYMPLATSDEVKDRIRADGAGPIRGAIQTYPVGTEGLPMITFAAVAPSPEEAVTLARRHVRAFTDFVEDEQSASNIPDRERLVVDAVNRPQPATLLEPRKKTGPIIIFLTVMTAVLGLAFVLENLRPRVRPVASSDEEEPAAKRRRSA